MNKDNKNELQEERRFVLQKSMMESELRIGRTLFNVSSRFKDTDTQFKDVIEKVTKRKINLLDRQTG